MFAINSVLGVRWTLSGLVVTTTCDNAANPPDEERRPDLRHRL